MSIGKLTTVQVNRGDKTQASASHHHTLLSQPDVDLCGLMCGSRILDPPPLPPHWCPPEGVTGNFEMRKHVAKGVCSGNSVESRVNRDLLVRRSLISDVPSVKNLVVEIVPGHHICDHVSNNRDCFSSLHRRFTFSQFHQLHQLYCPKSVR